MQKSAQGNHGSHSSHFSGDTYKHIYRIIEKSGRRAVKLSLYEEYLWLRGYCGYLYLKTLDNKGKYGLSGVATPISRWLPVATGETASDVF